MVYRQKHVILTVCPISCDLNTVKSHEYFLLTNLNYYFCDS